MNTAFTPAQVASRMIAMTGGKVDVDGIAAGYRATAADFREVAIKAGNAKSGKFRGFTPERAMANACNADALAVSVPAELRKLVEG